MKVNNNIFTAALLFAGMLTVNSASAQWSRNNITRQTYLTNNGDSVGIGTSNPLFKLDIQATGIATMQFKSASNNASILLDRGSASSTSSLTYRSQGTNVWQTGIIANDNYNIRNNGLASPAITVLFANNNVGIGNTNPTEKLYVNGNIKATGTISDATGISTNWNTAYGWGNHAVAGYITAETDPQVGINAINYASKWNGTSLVTSNIFSNGTFVGINTATAVGAGQLVVANANAGYGGMYLNSTGAAGARKPFYGYSLNGSAAAWTYLDEATNSWRVYNGGDKLTVESTGQVGIGTNTPAYYLDIQASSTFRALNASSTYVGSIGQIVNFERTSVPSAANDILQITVPAASPDDFQFIEADRGGVVAFAVNGNGAMGIGGPALTGVGLNAQLGTDVGPASGGYVVIGETTSLSIGIDNNEIMGRNNGVVSPLYLNNSGGNVNMCVASGSVNIGNTVGATGYILAVDGKAIAEEVRVELSGSLPDYVFEKGHSMMSIEELEAHVTAYKHLPGVPTACEVETTGIDLGSMQTKTMEKLEENTLYIIQLNNKIKLLEQKIDELTSKK